MKQDLFGEFINVVISTSRRRIEEDFENNFNGIMDTCIHLSPENKRIVRESLNKHEVIKILEKTVGQRYAQKFVQYINSDIYAYHEKGIDEDSAYSILGISHDATNDQIKEAYRKLSLEFHPDKATFATDGIKNLAKDMFIKIDSAYKFLKKKRNF